MKPLHSSLNRRDGMLWVELQWEDRESDYCKSVIWVLPTNKVKYLINPSLSFYVIVFYKDKTLRSKKTMYNKNGVSKSPFQLLDSNLVIRVSFFNGIDCLGSCLVRFQEYYL